MTNCVNCQSKNYKKNGKTRLGFQRYRCIDCGRSWSDNPKGRGRPPLGAVSMTRAERQKRYRESKKTKANISSR